MIIGVRREIKPGEKRVAITPRGVQTLLKNFQNLYFVVDHNAGLLSGYRDDDYLGAGNGRAVITERPEDMYQNANIVIGVKELQPSEYGNLESAKPGTIITCFWHVMDPVVQDVITQKGLCALDFEDMYGVLEAMSKITGERSVDVAAQYLTTNYIEGKPVGRGMLPKHATLTILGGAGVLGKAAYEIARHRFEKIIILELRKKLHEYVLKCDRRESTPENILATLLESDAAISGIHIRKKENPRPITEEMIRAWGKARPHAIFVDPAIDQGGSSETSRPTTHQNPVYLSENIIHYCVANMPGAFHKDSTEALEKALLPNLMELIAKTIKEKSGK